MTVIDTLFELSSQYGEAFLWYILPPDQSYYVDELRKEMNMSHPLHQKTLQAIAKCEANDDVLFICGDSGQQPSYVIVHLTWQMNNTAGFPRYESFVDVDSLREWLEKDMTCR